MGVISRLGAWLDTRFPEKISADTVLAQVSDIYGTLEQFRAAGKGNENRIIALEQKVAELEKKADLQVSEMNKAKVAFMNLRNAPPTLHR